MRATKRRSNSSATASWTMKRLAAMQLCPLFWQRAVTPTSAARSRSAEGSTTNGSLPPSSNTVFLTSSPATRATAWPAGVLPVRVAAMTRGSRRTRSTRSEPMSRVWNTPSGNPARLKRSSMNSAVWGTLEACLSSPTLPAMRAGAAKRIACHSGKFQGITARTGPMGR